MSEESEFLTCDLCKWSACFRRFPKGVPKNCTTRAVSPAKKEEIVERYLEPEDRKVLAAARKILATSTGSGQAWPRVKEAIEFAKYLNLHKIGIAFCQSVTPEATDIAALFRAAGFEVVSVICKVGGIGTADGMPEDIVPVHSGTMCNPATQAEILNQAGTEINYVLGLCMGHDVIFNKYSKALTSTLIVKDFKMGNNPAAALYAYRPRYELFAEYAHKNTLEDAVWR